MPAAPRSAAARRGPAASPPAAGERRPPPPPPPPLLPLRRPHPPLSAPPPPVAPSGGGGVGCVADLRSGEQARQVSGAGPSAPLPTAPAPARPTPRSALSSGERPPPPRRGGGGGRQRGGGRERPGDRVLGDSTWILHKSRGRTDTSVGLGQSATLLFGAGCDSQSLFLLQFLSSFHSPSSVSPSQPRLPSHQLWLSAQPSVS
ncbi:unnamed protein product [Bubo scandiacus]